jgi:predicted nucleic acid-binding protein
VIVADANVVAYLLLPGERTAEAEAVYRKDPEWVVPVVCLSELRSVLMQYLREAEVESPRVLELAASSKCSSYDCEYVALAEVVGVRLVTTDGPVLRAFPKLAVTPSAFLESESGAG